MSEKSCVPCQVGLSPGGITEMRWSVKTVRCASSAPSDRSLKTEEKTERQCGQLHGPSGPLLTVRQFRPDA